MPEACAKRAREYVDMGFTAVKLDPMAPYLDSYAVHMPSRESLLRAERNIAGIREAVGENCDIIIGTHGQFTAAGAIRVAKCLEQAGLTQAVEALPRGMDTPVTRNVFEDGVELSGGQMQRLMLARALYRDAPVVVLDEPTAALDPLAEHDIYMKYNSMTQGKSALFISHRLASTRFCDRILYLEHGRIAEEGTHQSLLDLGGGYAKLFEVQSRYYQEGGEF